MYGRTLTSQLKPEQSARIIPRSSRVQETSQKHIILNTEVILEQPTTKFENL